MKRILRWILRRNNRLLIIALTIYPPGELSRLILDYYINVEPVPWLLAELGLVLGGYAGALALIWRGVKE